MRELILCILVFFVSTDAISQTENNYYGLRTRVESPFVYDDAIRYNYGNNISENTLQVFGNADLNRDSKISVAELQAFQNWLKRNFKYKENATALHPDDFILQGGGDCEDFAIMTTCMLNYHGVVAYVAMFGRVTVNKHAVCIAQVTADKTPGYLYYTLSGWGIPSGLYIPIDYEKVGGLSAIDRRWKIARVYMPVRIYGVYM
jgi:hypothetical protein